MTGSNINYREKFEKSGVCVIIPTYNNEKTLAGVIADVSAFTDHIIVVNDGSTDQTGDIINSFPFVQQAGYQKNVGKGWALRKGFEHAIQQGYRYAISIDSDGQHFAKDLPQFLHKLEEAPGSIIIGARNMDQETVPGGSSFGNRFSNFWFRLETGISCPDTQSGYRLYPLDPLKQMKFFTRKYEFEIEVLVRLAWRGIPVHSVPVTVYYAPKEVRISHFRPYKDFARISLLNTVLVFICFLYIKPRNLLHSLFVKRNFRQKLHEHLFNANQSVGVKSASIGFGVFMGIVPIWGFQLMVAIFLSFLFRLNKALVIIAANISVPPMIPLIIFLSYKTGSFWMGKNAMKLDFSKSLTLASIQKNLQQYIYGSISLAVIAGFFFGLLTFIILRISNRKSVLAR